MDKNRDPQNRRGEQSEEGNGRGKWGADQRVSGDRSVVLGCSSVNNSNGGPDQEGTGNEAVGDEGKP
jgi:hypothetical protein